MRQRKNDCGDEERFNRDSGWHVGTDYTDCAPTPGWKGFIWELLIGILYLVAGFYLAFFPLAGLLTLTILIAALFLAEGIAEIVMAFQVRPHEGWGWVLLSGIAALAVGVMIGMDLPGSATWALGLLVGINLLFSGWSYVFLALAGRKAHERLATA